MKKKIGVFILTLTLMFGLCSNTVFAAYSDVYQNGWYYGAVQYVSQNGIMTGLNDTYFGVGESLKERAVRTDIISPGRYSGCGI